MTESRNGQGTGTALAAPTDNEIEQIRKRGRAELAYRKELKILEKQIAGMEWGSGNQVVRGGSFSPQTRYALAQFCRITRANPMVHVDILGGGPYLNAEYWADKINSDPYFHHYEQREISERTEEKIRARAAKLRQDAEQLSELNSDRAASKLEKAIELEEMADELFEARLHWQVPEWAQVAYETTIWRFINAAPIEAIRAGEIPHEEIEKWLVPVTECNWAGGRPRKQKRSGGTYDPDPIGNDEPEKTARTRSLRRCAVRAFTAWMEGYEQQIRKAEEVVEGEWEVIQDERSEARASLPSGTVASTGSGEPQAAQRGEPEDLPGTVNGAPDRERPREPEQEEPAADLNDLRKRYFATLRDAGVKEDGRKAKQREIAKETGRELPESTTDWRAADFEAAVEYLVAPERKKYEAGCEVLGVNAGDVALTHLGHLPDQLNEYQRLNQVLNVLANEDADAEAEQQELV